MDYLSLIKQPIEAELTDFIDLFNKSLMHSDGLLSHALDHIRQRAGKRMRPMLILLMARNFGKVTDVTQHSAVGLELLHTASLVHDDVVDESGERRGQASVNATYNNKVAVLVPANALFWGSLVVSSPSWITNQSWSIYLVLALIFITSFLLVCELPLFALKFKQWSFKGNEVKYCFAGFAIAVLAVSVAAEGARGFLEGWWPIILMYVLLSWIMFLKKK